MKTVLTIITLLICTWVALQKIDSNAITRAQYENLKERLIISEALVNKCAENNDVDIMQYVRDVQREIEMKEREDLNGSWNRVNGLD